jgi:ribosomal protein L11 methylase PrmA
LPATSRRKLCRGREREKEGLAVELRGEADLMKSIVQCVSSLKSLWIVSERQPSPGDAGLALCFRDDRRSLWDHALLELALMIDNLCSSLSPRPCPPDWQVSSLDSSEQVQDRSIFHVTPSWQVSTAHNARSEHLASSGMREVFIDAGWAFGNGCHPSTKGCVCALEWLERQRLIQGSQILDVGTGTGILAIISAVMGARSVTALDVNPEAIERARANVVKNSLEKRVVVLDAPLTSVEGGPWDVVLANLTVSVLYRLLPAIVRCLSKDGVLVVSGFRDANSKDVRERLGAKNLRSVWSAVEEGWEARAFSWRSFDTFGLEVKAP